MNTLLLVIILLLLIMVYLIISGYLPKTFRMKESFSNGKELLFEGFNQFRKKIAEAIHPSEQSSSESLLSSFANSLPSDYKRESSSTEESAAENSSADSVIEDSDEDSEDESTVDQESNSIPSRTTPPLSYTLDELSKLSETQPPKQVTNSLPKMSQTPTQQSITETPTDTSFYTKEKLFELFKTFMLTYLSQNKQLESLSQAKTASSYS